jgi:hypothetical protein
LTPSYNCRWVRTAIGLAFLLFQIAAIVYARFVPTRYFCWAPYDMQTDYVLEVRLGGGSLSPSEIRRRYRRPARGVDNRSVQHVIDIIEGVERRLPREQQAEVRMTYRINGKEERFWQWTPR